MAKIQAGTLTNVRNQILLTSVVNIQTFAAGCNIGWYSPALPVLRDDNGPLLDGPVSADMAGWIGASLAIGSLTGCLFFGLLGNYIGYKRPMLLTSVPLISSWLLIIFGKFAWQLCLARFLNGCAIGGSYACVPMFVAEIASDFIRGQLNSYIQIACYGGILVGFIGGTYIPFHINPWIMITLPVVFFILFVFMPESPQYLLKSNRPENAEKSLRFYRNCRHGDTAQEAILLAELEKFKAIAEQNACQPPLRVSDFFTPIALRAMMISPFLMAVNQFSGAFAISNYAETIFKQTGSTLDPQISSIVMAAVQVVGTYVASQLMDKMGRKVLLLISCSGAIAANCVTGAFVYLAMHEFDVSAFSWVPLTSISFFIFIGSIGLLPAPYVMLAEVIPAKIRRIATTICTCAVFITQAIMLRLMPLLLDTLQLYGSMWLFAGVCAAGLVFTVFVVKETKGMNLDVLEVKDAGRREEMAGGGERDKY